MKKALLCVLLVRVVFAVCALVLGGAEGFTSPDSTLYIQLAQSLRHFSFATAVGPELLRTPGYPLLLVPAVVSGHVIFVGIALNILLAVAAAWLIWLMTKELSGSDRAARIAVLLYAFEPIGLVWSENLLSETLFVVQLLIALWLLTRYLKTPKFSSLIFSALSFGLSAYTRPVGIYLGAILGIFFCFAPKCTEPRRRLAAAGLFFLLFLAAVVPWIARNYVSADYRGFSAAGDHNLYCNCAAQMLAREQRVSLASEKNSMACNDWQLYYQLHPEQRTWPLGDIYMYRRSGAWKILMHEPHYGLIHLKGIAVVLFDPAGIDFLSRFGLFPRGSAFRNFSEAIKAKPLLLPVMMVLGAGTMIYYWLALRGFRSIPRYVVLLFITVAGYLVIVSGFPGATGRYRAPIMPLACVAAGCRIPRRQN